MGAADVEALSKLPSREQLLGQFVGVLQGPLRNLVGVLAGVPRSFVQVLNAIEQKKAA
jgi:large subunit ribosomal protein L10